MAEYNSPNAEPPKFFSNEGILEVLVAKGYDEANCFIEPQGYNLITDLGDIRRAISLKFPETFHEDNSENKQILQNRSNALDQNDGRVRGVEKKFNQ